MFCLLAVFGFSLTAGCADGLVVGSEIDAPTADSVDVTAYGAAGTDTLDDTEAFAAALGAIPDSGGALYVPAGTYYLTPRGYAPRRGLDLTDRTNITVFGDGQGESVIKMTTEPQRGSVALVFPRRSSGITMRDLTLDGSWRDGSQTDEQTHCVDVWASQDLHFERVTFRNCKGDGVRLLGSAENWTERVVIEGSTFEDNGRSGIAVQRATRDVRIRGNLFQRISDQSIDFEATGTQEGKLVPTDYVIDGNTILHSTRTYAVTLGGKRTTFSNNRVENGAIFFYGPNGVGDALIEGNVIIADPHHRPFEIRKQVVGVRILNNRIEDHRIVPDGGVITLSMTNGHAPRSIVIEGNTLLAAGHGIHITDASDVRIAGNELVGKGAGYGVYATNVLSTGEPRSGFVVTGNRFVSFETSVMFAKRTDGDEFADVTVGDNRSESP